MLTIHNRADIEIDTQQVLQNIGYSTRRKPPARVVSLINEYVKNAHQLIEPSYSYTIRNIERVRHSSIFIEGSIVFRSGALARLLEQCGKITVFVVTIGNHLEETALRLAEDGLVLQSTALDAVGSSAVEKTAELVQNRIGEIAHEQGLGASRRFSPGYCDWALRQQKVVFRALNGNSLGVRLTKECLMLPRKSISGIIGIGPYDVENYNPCETCGERKCPGRR